MKIGTIQIHSIVKTEVEARTYDDSALGVKPAGFIQLKFSEAADGPETAIIIHTLDVAATLGALMAKAESALFEWERPIESEEKESWQSSVNPEPII